MQTKDKQLLELLLIRYLHIFRAKLNLDFHTWFIGRRMKGFADKFFKFTFYLHTVNILITLSFHYHLFLFDVLNICGYLLYILEIYHSKKF